MTQFTSTLVLALALIILALLGMGVGYIFGKKILKNRCGYTPGVEKDQSCGEKKSCSICNPEHDKTQRKKK